MQSDKLKNVAELLEYGGGRFLVVENGEPAFVVLDINEFKKINEAKQSSESALLKKINDDIEMWKEEKWDDEFDDSEEGFLDDDIKPVFAESYDVAKRINTNHEYDEEDVNEGITIEDVDSDEEDFVNPISGLQFPDEQPVIKKHQDSVGLEGIPF